MPAGRGASRAPGAGRAPGVPGPGQRGRRWARGQLPPATPAAPPSSTAAPGPGPPPRTATNAGDTGGEAAAPRQRGGQVNSGEG